MIYKFRSKATGDLIMLGPHGDQVMKILGREPAPKGVIEPAAMPAAVAALRAAIAAESECDAGPEDAEAPEGPRAVSLRQRLWPMIDMLERAHGEGHPIVWGV